MPQISLYIDEKTLKKVEAAALSEQVSISKWVAEQIRSRMDREYPSGYGELFGSVRDDTFIRPVETAFDADSRREGL